MLATRTNTALVAATSLQLFFLQCVNMNSLIVPPLQKYWHQLSEAPSLNFEVLITSTSSSLSLRDNSTPLLYLTNNSLKNNEEEENLRRHLEVDFQARLIIRLPWEPSETTEIKGTNL